MSYVFPALLIPTSNSSCSRRLDGMFLHRAFKIPEKAKTADFHFVLTIFRRGVNSGHATEL